MEKDKDLTSINHSISFIERKNILITGVKKVDSFDKEEFLVETIMGYLALKGEDLELVKLDSLAGSVTIQGYVSSFEYIEDNKTKDKLINREKLEVADFIKKPIVLNNKYDSLFQNSIKECDCN